jgi:predicted Zn-dependent protease
MNQRTKYGLFGGFTALIAALIAFAVLTHKEPGLMGACWDGDNVEKYEVDGAKECPPLVWNKKAPLQVYAYTTNPHPAQQPAKAINEAASSFNRQVKFNAYKPGERDDADVIVVIGVAHDAGWREARGRTRHEMQGGKMIAWVETTNEGQIDALQNRLLHELGHAYGLAHDPYGASGMHIGASSGVIVDEDGALLRRRYKQ